MGTLPCAKNGDGRSPDIQRRFTMALKVSLLSDHVGAEIRTDIDSLLTTAVAQEVRRVLIARGVVVFKELHLGDEQQLQLSRLMGTLREEGEKGIFKVTLDKSANERADYLKRSEEHTSELQSLMRISYAVFCLKKKTPLTHTN